MAGRNKLIPILAVFGALIVGTVLFKQFSGSGGAVKADAPMTGVPALPKTAGADNDTPTETLRTVVTSNQELRDEVKKILQQNKELQEQNDKLRRRPLMGTASAESSDPAEAEVAAAADPASDAAEQHAPEAAPAHAEPEEPSVFASAIDSAARTMDAVTNPRPLVHDARKKAAAALEPDEVAQAPVGAGAAPGAVSYAVMAPMGYALQADPRGKGGAVATSYVRTHKPAGGYAAAANGPASQAARAAKEKPKAVPFFTIPENATLAGAVGMTALIGRVPIDGRITDPLQFKSVIGRDNLAANGFEMPPDLAGMIISGIAVGDMALSCTEGRVRSMTFVFNDGTIRTISRRSRGRSSVNTRGGMSDSDYIGFVSDLHGNPCLPGEFVSNAAPYLTDMAALGTLTVAGQAYADAQRTVYSGREGSSSAVTGNVGHYALGQAVSGGANQIAQWIMQRLNNSFDAVIVPSGKPMVVHITQELQIDKEPEARKLVSRWQDDGQINGGSHYGLD